MANDVIMHEIPPKQGEGVAQVRRFSGGQLVTPDALAIVKRVARVSHVGQRGVVKTCFSAAPDAPLLLRVAVLILGAGVLGFSLRLGLLGRMFLVLVLFVSRRLRVLRLGRRRGLIRLGGGRRVGGGRLGERRRQGSEGGYDRRDNERF